MQLAQIIPKKSLTVERHWQKELAQAITDPAELLREMDLDPADFQQDIAARKLFPLRVPRPFVSRMQKGNVEDPLFKQVMSASDEAVSASGFNKDPLQEQDIEIPGLLHKYKNRVLLIIRGGCAVNCRYCFRRHFPYADNSVNKAGWQSSLDYIATNQDIDEVIYSGGDPLMAKDDFLAWLTQEIQKIPHVRRIRIHTRLPVVIPQRVTAELLDWFTLSRLKPVMVLHINHANEIDNKLKQSLRQLKLAGVTLLNQSVLLKNVNDSSDALVALSEALFESDVLPYYLHSLDKVDGASHFEVTDKVARGLMADLIKRLPGYLVPKLVREVGGQPGKTPIDLNLLP